jgi:hypothetical protein
MLGKKVHDANGKDVIGQIVDVLVGADGKPAAAIIDFGGFLGVGSRKIAVAWDLLTFNLADAEAPVSLALGRAELQAAPEYKEGNGAAEMVIAPPPSQVAVPASPDAGK